MKMLCWTEYFIC